MDLIDIYTHSLLAESLENPSAHFAETANLEWEFYIDWPDQYHTPMMSGERRLNDCCLQINDKKYEFLEPVMAERPKITIDYVRGNLKTLAATYMIFFSDMKISGGLRIIDDTLKTTEMSTFELSLENVKVNFLVGLKIIGDSFSIDNIIHKLKLYLSLHISKEENDKGKTWISPFDGIADDIRNRLQSYLAQDILKSTINDMKCTLKHVTMFDKADVNYFVGADYAQRDLFRMHKKRITLAFDQLISLLMKLANTQRQKKNGTFVLPDIVIPDSTKENGALKLLGGSVKCCNISTESNPSIDLMDERAILFVYIKIDKMIIKYDKYIDNTGDLSKEIENFKIPFKYQGYVKISVRKINMKQADINLMKFKIPELSFKMNENDKIGRCEICVRKYRDTKPLNCSLDINPRIIPWINYVLGVVAVPLIEDHFKNAIAAVVKNEKLMPVAIRPDNFEYLVDELYDSDSFDKFYSHDEDE